jgi:cellulose synthase/poly-beta-1,6-N-acetylglucosamine synthase-like glycosyltransferase
VSTALALTPALFLGPYVSTVLLHSGLQQHFRKKNIPAALQVGTKLPSHSLDQPPSVDVVIPTYNEDPDVLEACFDSLARQRYEGEMRFLVVDDGSSNIDALLPVYRRYQEKPNWNILLWRIPKNLGKRQAQNVAIYGDPCDTVRTLEEEAGRRERWAGSKAEFILMVDSDTVIEPDGVSSILTPFLDETVAAVTGDVAILNRTTNRLTELVDERYRLLFHHERAAQSHFGLVFCCAGPFSAYRLRYLDEVWERYLETKFGKSVCTFGDDLQLTNLMLERGHKSIFQPAAKASTTAPTTLPAYLRQQWRWNRSFYRQFRWILPVLRRNRNAYQVFDLFARTAPPLLLAATVAMTLLDLVMIGTVRLAEDLMTVGGMLLTGFAAVLWQTRKPSFALLYGLVYLVLLVPTRLWALCTLRDSRWGTRTSANGEAGAAVALPAE